jgi:hypothetical protein
LLNIRPPTLPLSLESPFLIASSRTRRISLLKKPHSIPIGEYNPNRQMQIIQYQHMCSLDKILR